MSQQSLDIFTGEFKPKSWESDWIIQYDLDNGERFKFKQRISLTQQVVKKQKKFFVNLEWNVNHNEEESFVDWIDFNSKERAEEFFDSKKDELIWLKQKNDDGFMFDGRRYFISMLTGDRL